MSGEGDRFEEQFDSQFVTELLELEQTTVRRHSLRQSHIRLYDPDGSVSAPVEAAEGEPLESVTVDIDGDAATLKFATVTIILNEPNRDDLARIGDDDGITLADVDWYDGTGRLWLRTADHQWRMLRATTISTGPQFA